MFYECRWTFYIHIRIYQKGDMVYWNITPSTFAVSIPTPLILWEEFVKKNEIPIFFRLFHLYSFIIIYK